MAYIQVNEKAPVAEQIRQLKNQLEIALDNVEVDGLSFVDLTPEQRAALKGKDGEDAPSMTPIADIYIDALIV